MRRISHPARLVARFASQRRPRVPLRFATLGAMALATLVLASPSPSSAVVNSDYQSGVYFEGENLVPGPGGGGEHSYGRTQRYGAGNGIALDTCPWQPSTSTYVCTPKSSTSTLVSKLETINTTIDTPRQYTYHAIAVGGTWYVPPMEIYIVE